MATLAAFIMLPGPQQYHFGRCTELGWSSLTTKSPISITLGYFGGWVIEWIEMPLATLCPLGSAACPRRRCNWELVTTWISSTSLVLTVIAPILVLSVFTGLLYRVPHHIKAMTVVLAIPLVVVALDVLCTWFSPLGAQASSTLRGALGRIDLASVNIAMLRAGAAVTALAACLPIMLIGSRAVATDVREGCLPVHGDTHFIADKAELDVVHQLFDELPDSAIVIGDPVAGTGYIPTLTGMHSARVFSGRTADDRGGVYLRGNFNRIHADPHVCELLQWYGIRYFYVDEGTVFNGNQLNKFRPGLYKADTSSGFTLVNSDGSAPLWRIDTCG